MADELFFKFDENAAEQGPIAGKDLRQLASSGGITPNSLIRRGDSPWVAASSVKGLEFAPPTVAAPPMAIPVEQPPKAVPVAKPAGISVPAGLGGKQPGPAIQPPTIQPPVSQVPPTATPVTPPQATPVQPAAESGSKPGLNFPSAPPKQGTQIPAGLGDLKFSPAKPAGVKGPAKTATQPAIVAPPVNPPAEEPATVVAPPSAPAEKEVEVSPQAAVASLAPTEEGELEMMEADDPMLAPKGKRKRPVAKRKGGGGGIFSVFSFNALIAPSIVKPLYYIYVALVILGWLGTSAAMIVVPLLGGEMLGVLLGVVASAATLVSSLLLIMLARVGAELVIVFFRINDQIGEALNRMDS